MEHRWSLRKPYQQDVVLSSPRHGSIAARTRDIGLGGMCIETDDIRLSPNSLVTVEFALGTPPRQFRLHAIVVRKTPVHAGIMFIGAPPETTAALRRALYAERRPPAHVAPEAAHSAAESA